MMTDDKVGSLLLKRANTLAAWYAGEMPDDIAAEALVDVNYRLASLNGRMYQPLPSTLRFYEERLTGDNNP